MFDWDEESHVKVVSFSPNDKYIVIYLRDNSMNIIDVRTRRVLRKYYFNNSNNTDP
jgi:hypothetical protein